jgi:CubicO group peptidase (beta-lactamase class C family)
VSLEARLADLAPEVACVNPWENSDPVRLVNLLEHTTGWPDIGPRILTAEGKGWPLLKGVQASSFDFVSRWRPGYFPVYNNAGPAVAGFVIEKATGQSFDVYVRASVLRPMGMASADFDLPPALAAQMARSYEADGREIVPVHHPRPCGSRLSARELAQLVRFYLGRGEVDGARILTEASVAGRASDRRSPRASVTNGYGLGDAPSPMPA